MTDRRAGKKPKPERGGDSNLRPQHRRYVYRGTTCQWCAAGYPAIAENQMITMKGEIVEVASAEVHANGDDLRARIADLA